MDFFSKFTKTEQSKPVSDDTQAPDNSQPALNSDIFNSAKVVTGAAQSYFTHQPADQSYDNAEVAGASADILKAASDYGKLDETQGVGKYVGQAETYLTDYKTSHTTAAAATTDATTTDTCVDGGSDDSIPTAKIPTTEEFSDKAPTYASGDDVVKVGTDASDEYDKSEGKTAGDGGGAFTEDDAGDDKKLYGGGYEEETEEGFSKKPASGIDSTTVGTDASDKYEEEEDTAEDKYSKKPSGGVPEGNTGIDTSAEYEQSGDGYENKTKSEDFSYKSSGGAKLAESGQGYEEDTAEDFSNKAAAAAAQPGSYSTTGYEVSDKYDEDLEGGGDGSFTEGLVGGFLKK